MSTSPRLLAIVAHPDDETFGCGSLLAHAAERGAHTVVVCATRGEAGEVEAGVEAPDGVAHLREAELRTAARLLGVAEVEVLDFVDSGMDGEPSPRTLCRARFDEVVAAVRSALGRHRPDVVVALDGSDGHRDHLRIRAAVERVLTGTPTPTYLHCLPRSLMHEWVRHHADDSAATAYTELPEIGTSDDELTTVLDTTAHLATREAAIAVHRSQRSPYDGLPDDLRRAFLGREHLIRVNPPWLGGPVERELTGLAGFAESTHGAASVGGTVQ